MTVSEILGVGAYTFLFALLVSIGVLSLIMVLNIMRPKGMFIEMGFVKTAFFSEKLLYRG
jgi:hypothetical protein